MSERLGVFGGTFDPVHLGHLRAAEAAREVLRLDRVLFVPAGAPPHRQGPVASALDRYAMVTLATAVHPRFVPSDLELQREGPSYTVQTLEHLRERLPESELFLILGSDAFAEVGTWREPDRVRSLCTLAVIARPDSPAHEEPLALALPEDRVIRLERPALPFSASEVRSLIKLGRSVRYLVPEEVDDYIVKRGLYR